MRDRYENDDDHDSVFEQVFGDSKATELPAFRYWKPRHHTLEAAVRDHACRLPVGDSLKRRIAIAAIPFARWAARHEPSAVVAAAFAVERCWDVEGVRTLLTAGPPRRWKGGSPEMGSNGPLLSKGDLSEVTTGLVDPKKAVEPGVIDAIWAPAKPPLIWAGDFLRPPVEALALVVAVLQQVSLPNRIIGMDLGHVAAVQALSRLVPWAEVIHCGSRAVLGPTSSMSDMSAGWADLIVINLPEQHLRRLAARLHGGQRWCRSVAEAQRPVPDTDSVVRLEEALSLANDGTVVAVIAALGEPQAAVRSFMATTSMIPLVVDGIAITDRPVLVRYRERPWTPWMIPPPTDRLVSLWRKT